jgi:hypothetical protein
MLMLLSIISVILLLRAVLIAHWHRGSVDDLLLLPLSYIGICWVLHWQVDVERPRRLGLMERRRRPAAKHRIPEHARARSTRRVQVHVHHHLLVQIRPIARVARFRPHVLRPQRNRMHLRTRVRRVRAGVAVAVRVGVVSTWCAARGADGRVDAAWRAGLELAAVGGHGSSDGLAVADKRWGHAAVPSHRADVAARDGVEHAGGIEGSVFEGLLV